MMGIGRASGDDRAREATEKAIKSPLLDDLRLENAKGLLVNVISSQSLSLDEFSKISEIVEGITDTDDANIFYGSVVDEDMGDELHVTVIATGLTLDEHIEPATPQSVPSVTSTQPVDPNVHTSALNSQKQSQAQLYQDSITRGSTQEQSPTRTNSIQDYLRRQQSR